MKNFQLFLVSATLVQLIAHAQQQDSGFISIDCGASNGYHDDSLDTYYITDDGFVSTGVKMQVSSQAFFNQNVNAQGKNLRAFPNGTRNCYKLTPAKGRGYSYLIRSSFFYGNYDGRNQVPKFDLYIDVNYWVTINTNDYVFQEIIYVPPRDDIHVCLVNTGSGTPLISVLELRLLVNSMYNIDSGARRPSWHINIGGVSAHPYRHPVDDYDRIWQTHSNWVQISNHSNWVQISNQAFVNLTTNNDNYRVPAVVLKTAATTNDLNSSMIMSWTPSTPTQRWYIYFHFLEIQVLQQTQVREFEVYVVGQLVKILRPLYGWPLTVASPAVTSPSQINFNITATSQSTLPPILNAVEAMSELDLTTPMTDANDVNAIGDVKQAYGVTHDSWQGDPCSPRNFSWSGLNCSYDSTPRIISLNLSSNNLTGKIADALANLDALTSLDLSDNQLTGEIPEFLGPMLNLKILNLTGNNLNGSVPKDLQKKANANTLQLSVDEYPNLCPSASGGSSKKTKTVITIVLPAIFVFVVVVVVVVLIVHWWKDQTEKKMAKKESQNVDQKKQEIENEKRKSELGLLGSFRDKMRFSHEEVSKITSDFNVEIGKGASGTVFRGKLDDGREVAVKVLSQAAKEHTDQFETDVKVLLKVHHRNLVPLLGYCHDQGTMALIYEHQAKGNLWKNLSGENANPLTWNQRVSVAVDAARGIEYLHHDCKPAIVHRDIKTENILLDELFQAKISDFGLSRNFIGAIGSVIATDPVGTHLYLDPQYRTSKSLTKKSDVYSFGVVLLELISGRSVEEDGEHIVDWAAREFRKPNCDLQVIVDPRLNRQYDQHSAIVLVKKAMSCVEKTARKRPDIREVHMEIRGLLDTTHDTRRRTESYSRSSSIKSPDHDDESPIRHCSSTRSTSMPGFSAAQGNPRRGFTGNSWRGD